MGMRSDSAGSWRPSTQSIIRLVGSAAGFLLLVQWLTKLGWQEVVEAVRRIPVESFLLAIAVMAISRLAVAARWHILMRSAGTNVSYGQSLRLTFAGLFASNFLPTTIGGDVVRLAGGIQFRLDAAICTASLIMDRLIGMFGMAMALPLGLPTLLSSSGQARAGDPSTHALLLVLGVTPLRAIPHQLWERLRHFSRRVLQAFALWRGNLSAMLGSLAFTWVHMLCLFVTIWLFVSGMGEELPFWSIGGFWSIVYFVTLLPISINGLGVQEVAISFFFSEIGGISLQAGLTLAILVRLLFMLASLPGIFFLPSILVSVREQREGKRDLEKPAIAVSSEQEG
jgi:uncharacterized membrane protein YbhN (UPF0104 family)